MPNITIDNLLPRLEAIRDEVEISANTATRVGQALIDMLSLIGTGQYVTLNSQQTITASKAFNEHVVFGDTIGGYDPEDGDWSNTSWELHADGSGFFNGDLEFLGLLHGRRAGTASEQRYFWYIDPNGYASFSRLAITDNAGYNNITLSPNGNASFAGNVTATTFTGDLNGTASNATRLGGKTLAELMDMVDDRYVSKEWLREVFRVYDYHGLEVIGNDTEIFGHGDVTDIQMMYGVWTNFFMSALGKNSSGGGGGGGGASTLRELLDTDIPLTITTGKVLGWNGSYWVPVDSLNAATLESYLTDHGYIKRSDVTALLNGYATRTYVDTAIAALENVYVRRDWFRKLFRAFSSSDNEIEPNINGTIDNIRAMVGLWTEQYLSALGQNSDSGSGGATTLSDLIDTDIPDTVASGKVLGWNGRFWVPVTPIDQTALADYLTTNGYLRQSDMTSTLADYYTKGQVDMLINSLGSNFYNKSQVNGFSWWGQQLANGVVTGAMTGVTSIDSLMYFSNGKVGIGTSGPITALHLANGYNLTVESNIYLRRYLFMNYNGEGIYFLNGSIHTHNSGQHMASVAAFTQSGSSTFHHDMTVSGLLTANGNIKTASYIDIGSVRIQYDATARMLKVVNVDGTAGSLYATGAISALGANDSGGSGSGADLATMWASLQNDTSSEAWDDVRAFQHYRIAWAHLPAGIATESYADGLVSDLRASISAAYLTKSDAASTYLGKTDAAALYLTKAAAASTYLSKTDATSTYLSKTDAAATYVTLSTTQSISGKKNFLQDVTAPNFIGDLLGNAETATDAFKLGGYNADYYVNRFTIQSIGGQKTFTAATTIQNTLYVSQRVGIGVSPDSAHSLITSGSILSEGSLHGTISVITDGDFRLRTDSKSIRIRYDEESNTVWFDGGTPSAPVNIATTGGVSALGISEADGEIPELTVNKLIAGDSVLYPTYDMPAVSQDGQRILTAYGPVALRNSLWLWGNLHLASETSGNDAHFFTRGKEVYVWFGYGTSHGTEPVYKLVKTEVQQ